jgi:hypothetical protein
VYNSIQLAQDLHNLELRDSHKLATFDIKDLYVNIPIQEILQITKSGLISKKLEKIPHTTGINHIEYNSNAELLPI